MVIVVICVFGISVHAVECCTDDSLIPSAAVSKQLSNFFSLCLFEEILKVVSLFYRSVVHARGNKRSNAGVNV